MPTYEYACKACHHEFEQFQSITAAPVRTCPKCGRKRVERKISIGGAVIFKGGGFYETDYRSDAYRKAQEAEKKEAEKKPDAPKADDKASEKPGEKSVGTTAEKSTGKPVEKNAEKTADKPASDSADSPARPRGKSHAREGRGIGNVLQLGKAPKSAKKSTNRKSAR